MVHLHGKTGECDSHVAKGIESGDHTLGIKAKN
jgi:hypothetical protein